MGFLAFLLASLAPNDKSRQDALGQQLAPNENDATMLERGCPAPSEVAVRQLASGLRLEVAVNTILEKLGDIREGLVSIDKSAASAASLAAELRAAADDRKASLDLQRQQLAALQELKTGLMALSLAPVAPAGKAPKGGKAAPEAPADPAAGAPSQ